MGGKRVRDVTIRLKLSHVFWAFGMLREINGRICWYRHIRYPMTETLHSAINVSLSHFRHVMHSVIAQNSIQRSLVLLEIQNGLHPSVLT
jgi:hypothetical protein